MPARGLSPPMSSMVSSPQCSTWSTGGTFCFASRSRAFRSISTDSSGGRDTDQTQREQGWGALPHATISPPRAIVTRPYLLRNTPLAKAEAAPSPSCLLQPQPPRRQPPAPRCFSPQALLMKVVAMPVLPERPVRPIR